MRRVLVWAFGHRADLLAAVVYGCLAYLSFNALADYANGHHLFPEPWGGYAFAVAIDGSVLYAFISFRRAQVMAGVLLVTGAAATYMLQRWHAQHAAHPLVVAGVVPGLMILVTFAWHRIREADDVGPVRAQAARDDRGHLETTGPTPPGHPRPIGRQPWSPQTDPQVGRLLAEGKTPYAIRKQLGLSDRKYKAVCKYRDDLRVAAQNGDRPKESIS